MAAKSWSVPIALASKARTVHAAAKCAETVFECRVLVQLLARAGLTDNELDAKLHELELAYHRRCDELHQTNTKPAKRARKGKG